MVWEEEKKTKRENQRRDCCAPRIHTRTPKHRATTKRTWFGNCLHPQETNLYYGEIKITQTLLLVYIHVTNLSNSFYNNRRYMYLKVREKETSAQAYAWANCFTCSFFKSRKMAAMNSSNLQRILSWSSSINSFWDMWAYVKDWANNFEPDLHNNLHKARLLKHVILLHGNSLKHTNSLHVNSW